MLSSPSDVFRQTTNVARNVPCPKQVCQRSTSCFIEHETRLEPLSAWSAISFVDMPKAAKRSACDRCREKRVRCPRPEDSTEPCARCVRLAAACVTGSPGYPGRPRKALVDGSPGPDMVAADGSLRGYRATLRDSDDIELHTPALDEPMSVNSPASWFGAGTSLNLLDDLGAAGLSKPAAHPPKGALLQDHSDPWSAHGAGSLFGFPLSEEGSASDSIPLSTVLHHQELPRGADNLDMMYAGQDSNMFDVDFLDSFERQPSPRPFQRPSATNSLMRFGEKMERHISAMGAFLSDPRNIMENCPEDSMDMTTENPVTIAIMCTEEFVDIIQNLKATTRSAPSSSSNKLLSPTASSVIQSESLSTETTLLILSRYLQLMRLYDSLFHDVQRCLCQISSETIKSIKVKGVFRIAGFSSLQDMPGKAYAKGVVEVIKSHIQTLERCMGLPAVYCLSSDGAASPKGIFADVDRAQLLHAVMAQEDVRSQRGNKSYVESIRENINNTVALFGD
ncbi:hypothetical protein N7510_002938 [Penicillium lagena]|uniref:uncharacterized protein n=1 Tax=Penicillium lagena TaxID=94218 RepID=UPI002540A1E8|nr:uncharacterized protein N7510_002938 [Penicillium lagena]KAJ5618954.1 hypothetical protein N7510_002938 [Penicillium lagena]